MKRPQLILSMLVFCASLSIVYGGQSETDKLFVGLTYDYERYSSDVPGDWLEWWAKWRPLTTPEVLFSGTYWALNIPKSKNRLFVTAAHVLQINTAPQEIAGEPVDGRRIRITGKRTRAYMGFLAYDIGKVGEVPSLQDVAFFQPRQTSISKDLMPLPLADRPPRVREQVSFHGFPSTSKQQPDDALVASVHEAQGYFVLNKAVASGYSGGPVFNAEGRVYGVITSTDLARRQTTVMRINSEMLGSIVWRPLAFFNRIAR